MNNLREEFNKELPTHYWVRGKDNDVQGEWRIEDVGDDNIHYIQDPQSFGYEVIVIPKDPQSLIDKIREEDKGALVDFAQRIETVMESYDHKTFESGRVVLVMINNLIKAEMEALNKT